ncbi:protease pro-enzyme activation domain-containing protein [Gryllotalpicola reticulitermitis]|uniref:Protease pro-enzyme activation domain-containing protein n=1 Tax=Gryllotalpicola reticulitermitis TaxID=1184153 RepID=A0ABV8Q3L1_9MICO
MTNTPETPNAAPTGRTPLPGSERAAAPGARAVARPADTGSRIEATLVLRRRAELPESVLRGAPLSRDELASRYGADPADVERVSQALAAHGVEIVSSDLASRRVRIAGTVDQLQSAFGTTLEWAESDAPAGGTVAHWHRTGELSVPSELDGVVSAVLGLDTRPQARANFRAVSPEAVDTSYTPLQLGTAYAFPANTDGSGRTVAIIELGGGFEASDLDTYFSGLGVASPTVTAVSVDGTDNKPGGDPNGADGEVALDIEVVGALAPAATILVYFAPNTDAGFVDAVSQAAHASPTPDAISISWGQSEDQWTAQGRQSMDDAFSDAAALGITVTVAAGDNGSGDNESDGKPHVDFPASSPHALACGGTRLELDSSGAVSSETVWNDGSNGGATGGGVSDTYPLPDWQQPVDVSAASGGKSGRGVPDVAAVADPATGYKVRVDGNDTVIGGTSAVAPLWAALITRLVQASGKPMGLAQTALYAQAGKGTVPTGFRDITSGSNGAYSAAAGWDPCTGLGSPNGTALAEVIGAK